MMNLLNRLLSAPLLTLAISASHTRAGVISYNWDLYGTIPSDATSSAGVVSAVHWNNSYPARNTPPTAANPTTNLKDDSGNATTLDIHFSGAAQWQLAPFNTAPTRDLDGSYNKRLLKGYVDMIGGQPVTVTLSQIPYARYDIYIYFSSDAAGREGYVTDGVGTYFFRTQGSAAISGDNATLIEATETADLTPNAEATYARFSNLSGTSKSLSVFALGNAGIAGIQVVELPSDQIDGTWTATGGNWSDPANWLNAAVAQGANRIAMFDGSTPAAAVIDASFSIGTLVFSGADHRIDSGAGALMLQATSAPPSIHVEPGRTATIATALLGSAGLQKHQDGTLVLAANSQVSGTTEVLAGSLVYQGLYASESHVISSGAVLEIQTAAGRVNGAATTFSGAGTLRKTGAGRLVWPASRATFNLAAGALIDVKEGTFTAGSDGNEVWTNNASDLHVETGALFSTVEANVRVNNITGNGTISTGFSGAGYQSLTIGVADGSSTFAGSITNTDDNPLFVGRLVKQGTGTITLAGTIRHTGDTTIQAGALEFAESSQLRFVVTDTPAANRVTGPGTAAFHGAFEIVSTGVSGTSARTWLLVDRNSLTDESFGPTFHLVGFTQGADEVTWTMTDARGDWSFSEITGELSMIPANDYLAWQSATGVTGAQADDDDGDGLSNFTEYAFGLDPRSTAHSQPISVPLDSATGRFSYTRRIRSKTGLSHSVWFSTDLVNWSEDTAASEGIPDLQGDVETVEVTLSSLPGNPLPSRLFIQVRAR